MTEQECEIRKRRILQFYGSQITALREQMTLELIEISREFYRQQRRQVQPVETPEPPVEMAAPVPALKEAAL